MENLPPHVLIFPLQAQGHVTSMLKLAELFSLSGLHVTFLLSHRLHARLVANTDIEKRLGIYKGFRVETISDGIPFEGHESGDDHLTELIDSISKVIKPNFEEMICSHRLGPVTCMIIDGIYSFSLDLGIPVIYMRTISACSFWSYFCIPRLIESGELPFDEICVGNNLDVSIKSVPGMEGFLRQRDLPSFFRLKDTSDRKFQYLKNETQHTTRAKGFILNTFEELEAPILAQLRTAIPNLYTIGPLHLHLNARLKNNTILPEPESSTSLWKEDRSCLTWLDSQPIQSVVYVSFGSITVTTKEQMMEFWHGLVSSGKRFLWVVRPDIVVGGGGGAGGGDWKSQIPIELEKGTLEKGFIVEWAPQQEVLAHQAVGGFMTHSGWNSTLESIVAGKPMICWPYFADQQINSRFVGEVWKLGLDMKDTCNRGVVERMIKYYMDVKKNEFVDSSSRMADLAKKAVGDGGSSCCNLDRLIEDIRLMCLPSSTS